MDPYVFITRELFHLQRTWDEQDVKSPPAEPAKLEAERGVRVRKLLELCFGFSLPIYGASGQDLVCAAQHEVGAPKAQPLAPSEFPSGSTHYVKDVK